MSDDELDDRCGPLFDMLIEFERRFVAHAIDIAELSDEEAEREAANMDGDYDLGRAFAALLRRVKHERIARELGHRCAAVWAANGTPEGGMSIPEIHAEYAKLNKGAV
jgi:hypothetical protein